MSSPSADLLAFLEGLPEPHILFDGKYRIVAANAAYRRRFSPHGSVVGRTCYEVSHRFDVPCDEAGESCPLARARESGQRERVLHLHHTPHGEEYVNIELVPLHDERGKGAYYIEKMEPVQIARGQAAAEGLVGRSPAFKRMLERVARVAPSRASVLLLGESGTGKELVARAIHEASPRAAAPLVVVDCSSLPETLFESELFGHERGAFTGATAAKPGLVEAASGGTLFLDEVGDIPLTMQVKLLRLLETSTYRRVGSTELRQADVRVISATHRNLRSLVAAGRFREDLYHRLNTFPIRLPPLRERAGDLPLLVDGLLSRVAPGRHLKVSQGALARLARHPFGGNVRELRNVLERASLLCDGDRIEASHIADAMESEVDRDLPVAPAVASSAPGTPPDGGAATDVQSIPDAERQALIAAVRTHRGTRAALAKRLGISERTLYRKLGGIVEKK